MNFLHPWFGTKIHEGLDWTPAAINFKHPNLIRMEQRREEQEQHERLCHLRGFKPLEHISNAPKVRLKRGDEVWYEGAMYRVIHVLGNPKLEKVDRPK
jgi:hypothetical protein